MEMNALANMVSWLEHYKTTGDVSDEAYARLIGFADMANRYFTAYVEDPSVEYSQVLKDKSAYPTAQEKVDRALRERGVPKAEKTKDWLRKINKCH